MLQTKKEYRAKKKKKPSLEKIHENKSWSQRRCFCVCQRAARCNLSVAIWTLRRADRSGRSSSVALRLNPWTHWTHSWLWSVKLKLHANSWREYVLHATKQSLWQLVTATVRLTVALRRITQVIVALPITATAHSVLTVFLRTMETTCSAAIRLLCYLMPPQLKALSASPPLTHLIALNYPDPGKPFRWISLVSCIPFAPGS